MPDLHFEEVSIRYGGIHAVSDVSLTVRSGAIVGLIGPNGAGKTSLINAASGVVAIEHGSIRLDHLRLDRLPAYRIARAGVARTYQNIRLFGALSVRTNLNAGAYRLRTTMSDDALRALLERVGIRPEILDAPAGGLPYGEQRRLELARALAARPSIILLDEPAAGMNPVETAGLGRVIRCVASDGVGILLVEHDMSLVRSICDDVVVLNFGKVIAHGTPTRIAADPAVIEAYLGADVGTQG
jgi:ABC-type branched-subunit amino acid transport system ATPase component